MLFRQNMIEFTNLEETYFRRNSHFRVVIWYKNGRIENFVRSLRPRGLNQIIVGTDRRHVLCIFKGMSHEITYTGPLIFQTKQFVLTLNFIIM